jgi:5,10-methylenetetrahydrofolate reductase
VEAGERRALADRSKTKSENSFVAADAKGAPPTVSSGACRAAARLRRQILIAHLALVVARRHDLRMQLEAAAGSGPVKAAAGNG